MWYKKRNKMQSISAILCVYVSAYLCSCQTVTAQTESRVNVAQHGKEIIPTRYSKDDGVAKIGFDNAYDDEAEIEDTTLIRSAETEAEYDKTTKTTANKSVQTDSNDSASELDRSTRLKELAKALSSRTSLKVNSQELRGKEKRLIPLEDADSTSSESRSLKQQGVPFFIADDGKSIQLPQSDVIYNTETGEILIRNRVTDKMKSEAEVASAEIKPPNAKGGYFNIRPDGIGFKNLQGFVIADNQPNVNSNKPFLHPVAEDSRENESHEVTARRKNTETEDRISNANRKHSDSSDVELEAKKKTIKLDEINDTKHEVEPKLEVQIAKEELLGDSQRTTPFESATEPNVPILMQINKIEIKTIEGEGAIREDSSRSGKQVSKNVLKERTTPSPYEQRNAHASKSGEDPETTERENDFDKWNSRTAPNEFYNSDKNFKRDGTTEQSTAANQHENSKNYIGSASSTGTIEPQTSNDKSHSSVRNNSVQSAGDSEEPQNDAPNNEESKKMVEELMINPTYAKDAERNLETNEEMVRRIGDDMIINNPETVAKAVSQTTTTQKPDPLMVLRSYLEDIYLRGPIAIVVDVESRNLMRTRNIWTSMEAIGGNLNITDAVLFGYDANGITSMSYHKGLGANRVDSDGKSLAKALYGMTTTSKYASVVGNPRVALGKAAQLLPYDSAVFLFEGDRRDDAQQLPDPSPRLMKQLLTKRIKLYTVASSTAWSSGAALASGGAALALDEGAQPNQRELRALSVYYDSSDEEELVYDEQQTLLILAGVSEPTTTFQMSIDSSIRIITVNISGTPQVATVDGPEGITVDLLDAASVGNFSSGSLKTPPSGNSTTARLALVKASAAEEELQGQSEPYQGTWNLTIVSNTTYDILVTAETNLRVMAKLVPTYLDHGPEVMFLKIAAGGAVASLQEVSILDLSGRNISRLAYKYMEDNMENDATEIETLRALESGTVVKRIKLPETLEPGTNFRIQVEGRNDRNEQFVRVSSPLVAPDNEDVETLPGTTPDLAKSGNQMLERGVGSIEEGRAFNSTSTNGQQQVLLAAQDGVPMTAIQVGTASRLYGAPGAQIQVHFEVTNNRENAVYFRFGAKDDQYFLRSMIPLRQWINAGQTANVIVSVGITSTAENNVRDTITFTANGLEPSTLSAYVYVETDGRITSDRSRPSLRHDFRGDCQGYLDSSNCASRTWGLDIAARDTDSGLMKIAVSPGTLVYQQGFYAGGREESRARFTASCCQQTVVVSATDVAGNIASYEVNVSQYFTPAMIAAIALGVLLFIALIVVLALLIRMCIRRRRASRDMPSYQTTTRTTRTP